MSMSAAVRQQLKGKLECPIPFLLESITERGFSVHCERHRPVSGGTEASPSMASWACPTKASAFESSHAGQLQAGADQPQAVNAATPPIPEALGRETS